MESKSLYVLIKEVEPRKEIRLEKDYKVTGVNVYLNGLRLFEGDDYTADQGLVVFNGELEPNDRIIIDFVIGEP
jgi:hypothetical protein